MIGLGADWPRPHRLVFRTTSHNSSSVARSRSSESPAQIRSSKWYRCVVPTRHGTHLPHDSDLQKSMKNFATSTMHEPSSVPIMPPEPMMEPTLASDS